MRFNLAFRVISKIDGINRVLWGHRLRQTQTTEKFEARKANDFGL